MDSQMKSLLCVAGVWRVKKACENGGTRTAVRRNILWAKGSNSDRTSKNLKDWKHCFLFLRNFKPDVIIETDSLWIIKHQLKQVLVGYEVTIFKPKTYQNPSLTSFPSRTELWGKVPRPVWVAFTSVLSSAFEKPNHLSPLAMVHLWLQKNTEEEGDWMFYMNLLDSGWCFQTCFIVLRFYPSFEQIRLRWILLQWVQAMTFAGNLQHEPLRLVGDISDDWIWSFSILVGWH